MKNNIQTIYKLFFYFLVCYLCINLPLFPKKTIEDYHKTFQRNFNLLQRIYTLYPLSDMDTSKLKELYINWEANINNYKSLPTLMERKEAYSKIINQYRGMQSLLIQLNSNLKDYSQDIVLNFTTHFKENHIKSRDEKEIYFHALKISNQEKYRAQQAIISNKNYYYSNHLYHRAIKILVNTYVQLGWTVPTTYTKLIVKKKETP